VHDVEVGEGQPVAGSQLGQRRQHLGGEVKRRRAPALRVDHVDSEPDVVGTDPVIHRARPRAICGSPCHAARRAREAATRP
jgi:hypothetical protein